MFLWLIFHAGVKNLSISACIIYMVPVNNSCSEQKENVGDELVEFDIIMTPTAQDMISPRL